MVKKRFYAGILFISVYTSTLASHEVKLYSRIIPRSINKKSDDNRILIETGIELPTTNFDEDLFLEKSGLETYEDPAADETFTESLDKNDELAVGNPQLTSRHYVGTLDDINTIKQAADKFIDVLYTYNQHDDTKNKITKAKLIIEYVQPLATSTEYFPEASAENAQNTGQDPENPSDQQLINEVKDATKSQIQEQIETHFTTGRTAQFSITVTPAANNQPLFTIKVNFTPPANLDFNTVNMIKKEPITITDINHMQEVYNDVKYYMGKLYDYNAQTTDLTKKIHAISVTIKYDNKNILQETVSRNFIYTNQEDPYNDGSLVNALKKHLLQQVDDLTVKIENYFKEPDESPQRSFLLESEKPASHTIQSLSDIREKEKEKKIRQEKNLHKKQVSAPYPLLLNPYAIIGGIALGAGAYYFYRLWNK